MRGDTQGDFLASDTTGRRRPPKKPLKIHSCKSELIQPILGSVSPLHTLWRTLSFHSINILTLHQSWLNYSFKKTATKKKPLHSIQSATITLHHVNIVPRNTVQDKTARLCFVFYALDHIIIVLVVVFIIIIIIIIISPKTWAL